MAESNGRHNTASTNHTEKRMAKAIVKTPAQQRSAAIVAKALDTGTGDGVKLPKGFSATALERDFAANRAGYFDALVADGKVAMVSVLNTDKALAKARGAEAFAFQYLISQHAKDAAAFWSKSGLTYTEVQADGTVKKIRVESGRDYLRAKADLADARETSSLVERIRRACAFYCSETGATMPKASGSRQAAAVGKGNVRAMFAIPAVAGEASRSSLTVKAEEPETVKRALAALAPLADKNDTAGIVNLVVSMVAVDGNPGATRTNIARVVAALDAYVKRNLAAAASA